MATVFIKNYGCCANHNNGELMAGLLERENYKLVDSPLKADILVINACIVKQTTEARVRYTVEEAAKSGKKLVIAGCMPEAEYNLCKKIAPNAALINTFHVTDICAAIKNLGEGKVLEFLGKRKEIKNCLPIKRKKEKIANIQISEGCLSSCSFCIVKKAKGPLQSFPQEKIVEDVKNALREGCTTINLTSQDNAAYGLEQGKQQLPFLLKELLKSEGNYKIRVGMMNPEHVLLIVNELIEIFKNQKIKKFLHVPVQTGSDKVLKDMNRNYRAEDFKNIVNAFRKEIKNITISTDIIVGYPTEIEEDFKATVDLVKAIKPDVINLSRFGARPGTLAARLKPLPTEEVKRRSKILSDLFQAMRRRE